MPSIDTRILERIGSSAPSIISPAVAALCREIAPQSTPRLVPVRPEPGAEIGECFNNVQAKVARSGGSIVYGWAIWMWPRVFVEAEHHGVWDDGTGNFVDVTPHMQGDPKVMFLPDPARVYDYEGKRRLLNIKRSLGEVEAAQRWIEATDQLSRFLEENSNGETITFDRRYLLPIVEASRYAKAEVLISLAARTQPNDPCVCGSRQRFRSCCAPFISLD